MTSPPIGRARTSPRSCGAVSYTHLQTKGFGRIAAQSAKQVIIQGIREAEHGMIFDSFSSRQHEILMGTVLRIDPITRDMTCLLYTSRCV